MRHSIHLFILFFVFSCNSDQKSQKKIADKPIVVSVNYPLHYFAKRIGGEFIEHKYPIPTNIDPAWWIPDDDALAIYQSADIILANGAGYAQWMNHVSLPASRVINTSLSMKERYIPLKDISTHSHGPEGEHEHTGYAFTTWLDFEMAAEQAEAIKKNIVGLFPDKKDTVEENFISLKNELLALHEYMKDIASLIGDQPFIGSHPVYQYIAQAYSINIQSVHFEPDELPTKEQWKEFDHLLAHHSAKIMLWEGEPLTEIKKILKEKGIHIVVFNPCGNKPESGDFIEIMNRNINALQQNIHY